MRKIWSIIIIIAVVLIVVYFVFLQDKEPIPSGGQLGDAIAVRTYSRAEALSVASVSVPFTGSDERTHQKNRFYI